MFAAPGEARADWQIISDVAARLGHGEAFAYAGPADIFREYAAMTALAGQHGKVLDLTAWARCSDQEYEAMQPFQWGGRHPLKLRFPTRRRQRPAGQRVAAGHGCAGSGVSAAAQHRPLPRPMAHDDPHRPDAKLSFHRREPLVEVNPHDAGTLGLTDGAIARVATRQGEALYRVALSAGQRRGEIFVPMHWSDLTSGAGRTGKLVEPITDPHSGQPAFKNMAAAIEAVQPDWRAFLLTREPVQPEADYWARSRIDGGWLLELAGDGELDAEALLPLGVRSEARDDVRGMLRIVVAAKDGGSLAALYATRAGQLPDRDWVIRQFAESSASPTELLAGRPSAPPIDRGDLVCVCFDVGEKDILRAVDAGAANVGQVCSATRAGTNCGSCRTIIAGLLKREHGHLPEPVE